MAAGTDAGPQSDDRVLVIRRAFDAPRSLVFMAWTRPEHLARWWGPKGFTVLSYEADARPGGRFRFGIRSPEGTEHWAHGTYREVAAPERLVFTTAWEHPDGSPKQETIVTVEFEERDGRTELTLHQAVFESVTARDLHDEGWSSTLDLLADYVAKL